MDTNLFLLLVVGTANPALIVKHKKLGAYSEETFELLLLQLDYAQVVITPNTAAETSNLLRLGVSEPLRSELSAHFGSMLRAMREAYVPSSTVADHSTFVRLGLSDAALSCLADGDMEILTADFDLYWEAVNSGRQVVNFNHVREEHGV